VDPSREHEHAPGPSLWPVGFAVGVVVLLVGFVVSWAIVAIGAFIAVFFAFLWLRELTHGSPLAEKPEQLEPEKRAPSPAAVPRARREQQEVERYPRNVFLEASTLGLGAVIGALVTLPAIGAAILPGFLKQKAKEVNLGPIENFAENKYYVATFARNEEEGQISHMSAFIRNNGMENGSPSFTCISNRCVHLGCPVQAGGPLFEQQAKNVKSGHGEVKLIPALPAAGFICPCHGGAYDQEGNRIAGPPVRALNRFEFSIIDGNLVLGSLYSVAKVEGSGASARIVKYELAGPGQHVDGPESWLYPLQPPH
jgi:Rieske Fe-S protein